MYLNSKQFSSMSVNIYQTQRIFVITCLLLLFMAYMITACYDGRYEGIKNTNPSLYRKLVYQSDGFTYNRENRHHHRHARHHHNRHHRQLHNSNHFNNQIRQVKKRCQYSDKEIVYTNPTGQRDTFASKVDANYRPFSHVKHHQIRDGQKKPYYLGSSIDEIHNSVVEQPEIERIYVNIGETVNLTCNIATREIDWHFMDMNLTTTILSYGLQLQVRQAVIHNAHNFQEQLNDYHFQELHYDNKLDEQVLKYKLNSDMQSNHQLTLYIESSKDEGSYQCVDSKSETPVKKTIHVILKSNSGALMSGFNNPKVSKLFFLFISLIPLVMNLKLY